jgi:hypothetical protein
MVLWRSNTAHCIARPKADRRDPHWRRAIYTCYAPAARATAKQIQAKREAHKEFRVSNHYPFGGKLFPQGLRYPGSLRVEDCTFPKEHPPMTPLGRRVFGLESWA